MDERGHLMLCCQLAGVAGEPDPRVDLGDLAEVPLVEAHARLLEVVQEYERERLAELREHAGEGWGLFLCNRCLRRFGKPYWTDEGSAGGRARRARWRGAWDPQRRFGRSS